MKGLWAGALSLSLGSWLTVAAAEDVQWRPVAPPSVSASPGSASLATAVRLGTPTVSLGRPVAAEPTPRDATVQRTSFTVPDVNPGLPVVRLQAPDVDPRLIPHNAGPVSTELIAPPARGSMFAVGDKPAGTAPEGSLPAPTPLPPGASLPPGAVPAPGNPAHPGFTAFTGGPPAPDDPCCYPDDGPAPCCGLYTSAEYLLWWIRKDNYPPLVSVGPPNQNGFLPSVGTVALYGGGIENGPFSGGRVTLGYEFDPAKHFAVEGSFFGLGQRSVHFLASSSGFPNEVIARPFTSLNGNQFANPGSPAAAVPLSELVAFPQLANGTIDIRTKSELYGAEANLRCNLWDCCWGRVDGLVGFRYLDLEESLSISENVITLPTGTFPQAQDSAFDNFATRNQFYGGQVGLEGKWRWGDWELDILGKVALGATYESVQIAGHSTQILANGTINQAQGGLLALPNSNIGLYTRSRFAVVPETTLTVAYHLTENLKLTFGYTYLGWSSVLRPGDQIDTGLDLRKIASLNPPFLPNAPTYPAPVRPGPIVPMRESSFWAQGVNIGLAYKF